MEGREEGERGEEKGGGEGARGRGRTEGRGNSLQLTASLSYKLAS